MSFLYPNQRNIILSDNYIYNCGSAFVAYSLRKLNQLYNGASIRIRRISDNLETDIYFTAIGDLNETAINTFAGGTSATITIFYDQSGNGKNLIQTNNSLQPVIYSGGSVIKENSRPSIFFNSTTSLYNSLLLGGSINHIYLVGKETLGGDRYFFDGDIQLSKRAGISSNYRINAGVNLDSSFNDTVLSLKNCLFNGANSKLRINTTDRATGNAGSNSLSAINVGLDNFGSNGIYGNISEIVIFNKDNSLKNSLVESNVISYYSL